jgi:hypothetical protein
MTAKWMRFGRRPGGILGGVIYRWLSEEPRGQVTGASA